MLPTFPVLPTSHKDMLSVGTSIFQFTEFPTSFLLCFTSHVPGPTSYILRPMSHLPLQCPMSNIQRPTSYIYVLKFCYNVCCSMLLATLLYLTVDDYHNGLCHSPSSIIHHTLVQYTWTQYTKQQM